MKRAIFLLLSGFALSLPLAAQTNAGVKADLNISSVASMRNESNDPKIGFAAGGFVNIHFNSHIGITTELLYSQKGNKAKPYGMEEYTRRLNYLVLPILFFYEPANKFKIYTGPELGSLLSAKTKASSGTNNVKKYFETFDKGWVIGGSYTISDFGVTVRYVHGFKGLMELTDNNGNEVKVGSNRVVQLGVFYVFKKSNKKAANGSRQS